jgi:hypothetical protein
MPPAAAIPVRSSGTAVSDPEDAGSEGVVATGLNSIRQTWDFV